MCLQRYDLKGVGLFPAPHAKFSVLDLLDSIKLYSAINTQKLRPIKVNEIIIVRK